MMTQNINCPITVFDIEDFLPDKAAFIEKTRHYFFDLPWDQYDMRRKQLDFLKANSQKESWEKLPPHILKKYFIGEVDLSAFTTLIQQLSTENQIRFHAIKPFRRRSAMRLLLTYHPCVSNWSIERVPVKDFSQEKALIEDEKNIDYRHCPRQFTETKDEMMDDVFDKVVRGIANLVKSSNPNSNQLDITVHHTYVEATAQAAGDNSPEGIHQDGYDYIVSALVIERKNITGGVSQIFAEDKKTKLFSTKLRPGQGILQPDQGTFLWHNVTPFSTVPQVEVGYRSSIGFDIGVI